MLTSVSFGTWKSRGRRGEGWVFLLVGFYLSLLSPEKAQHGVSGCFFCLQEILVKRSEDFIHVRCFCILSPNHLGEKE